MVEFHGRYGTFKCFANTIEESATAQIIQMGNSVLAENAHIRIMPDCHAGAGCVIGTTMLITDKVCPSLVGVDIGCGVDLVKTDIDFSARLQEFDDVIRKKIPFGASVHSDKQPFDEFSSMRCWKNLHRDTQDKAMHALGTLGGGNHFIEAYSDGYLAVHSGSRNIGYKVADFYQHAAEKHVSGLMSELKKKALEEIPSAEREAWLKEQKSKVSIDSEMAYLSGAVMDAYLNDMAIMQRFAVENRKAMLNTIVRAFGGNVLDTVTSTHNYIDMDGPQVILRKGAISAKAGEVLVIPMNMRDGVLLCKGKGNEDWNFSAPHGAGRLYSRSQAKKELSLDEYQDEMKGIFSTCISRDTLDESPMAYKAMDEIVECIQPTVEILKILKPIYNFKASE